MAATFRENLNLTGGSTPERVSGAWVSATFLDVLGIAPQIGRSFRAEEDQPGQDLVAIISHGLWQRRFGAQPDIVDSTVVVNGRPHVVVGVMPEGFDFPRDTELWLPIAFDVATEDRGARMGGADRASVAGRSPGHGPGRPRSNRREARTGVPRHQRRTGRQSRPSQGNCGRRRQILAPGAAGRRGLRAPHRVGERDDPPFGANGGADNASWQFDTRSAPAEGS